jgi:hypothetical protein
MADSTGGTSDMLRAMIYGRSPLDIPVARRRAFTMVRCVSDLERASSLQECFALALSALDEASRFGLPTEEKRLQAHSALAQLEQAARRSSNELVVGW